MCLTVSRAAGVRVGTIPPGTAASTTTTTRAPATGKTTTVTTETTTTTPTSQWRYRGHKRRRRRRRQVGRRGVDARRWRTAVRDRMRRTNISGGVVVPFSINCRAVTDVNGTPRVNCNSTRSATFCYSLVNWYFIFHRGRASILLWADKLVAICRQYSRNCPPNYSEKVPLFVRKYNMKFANSHNHSLPIMHQTSYPFFSSTASRAQRCQCD